MPFRKSGRAILRFQCCCELAEIHYTHSVGALPYPLLFVHKMKIKKIKNILTIAVFTH